MAFSGLGLHLGNLSRLSNAQTRSISPENFTGEKGKGGMSVDGPAARQARERGSERPWASARRRLVRLLRKLRPDARTQAA